MGAQKIPLFEGIMKAVGDSTDPSPFIDLFTPPDANLLGGTQAFYEVHMWVVPQGDDGDLYKLQATDGVDTELIWVGSDNQVGPFQKGLPIKMLDGYPVRGDVIIQGSFLSAASSSHVYGYYYRVGQGEVIQPARRFIGKDPGLAVFNNGVPFNFAAGSKQVIHRFVSGRIDEISLALMLSNSNTDIAPAPTGSLRFEDANGVILAGTTPIPILVLPVPDYRRNPASPYNFYQIPLGGNPALPALAQLSLEADPGQQDFSAHGYFTRH